MTAEREDLKTRFLSFAKEHRAMLLSGLATVVVLAAVIFGIAAFGPWRGQEARDPNPIVVGAAKSKLLYDQALEAQRSGDTTKAAQLAKQALAADPSNQDAKELVEEIESSSGDSEPLGGSNGSASGAKSDSGSSGGSESNKPKEEDPAFLKATDDLGVFLPARFSGYLLGEPVGRDGEISLAATPARSGQPASRLIWAVHDRKSKSGAKEFLTSTSREIYAEDEASLTIDGASGYFGTDGTRFATAVYTRGRFVFEVLVTGEGVDPKSLKTLATQSARAFSDAPPK